MQFCSKRELMQCLEQDAFANGKMSVKTKLFGDEIWKYIKALRYFEYYSSRKKHFINYCFWKIRHHSLGIKYGFQVPANVVGAGFSIAHIGNVIIAAGAQIGNNFRIHEGCTVGATNGSCEAAVIGNNVFCGSGAKIIGKVKIADDVCIAANSVVVRDISEPGTTWGGIPAKKISENDSHSNLSKLLNL